ncbi:MAG: DNA polymerase III subunit delta' [Proteobacteria bacterium]|nr:DNA polymerase III subunit delta' [Pseudomonadota bacterium]MBU1389397.1 DNA polymerase III subunit delta' [Pseudomonadota bacterium]MBU1541217.1 DNA polymerase III subunit delta' [Pseudomonadota bacterium]MBU2430054.1 DNA polymerase III subunit delta' [Pseudomonadota bacterium]MBU2479642.1 DNA polymerase III subunit delta' [Pseudomonadota bacterium]
MGIDQTMSDFDQIHYQTSELQLLARIIQTQKIPNALLFCGRVNTGKKQAAFLFAKGCNCLEEKNLGCQSCDACRKIDGLIHPDMLCLDLEKDKKNISIAQIRQMGENIRTKPNEAKFRMVLILNSDKMNMQAQNALLKMLEEPPGKTFFILTATDESKLLPTIHSRCQSIRFKPLSETDLEHYLKNNFNIDPVLCHIASKIAGSDPEKAKMFAGIQNDALPVDWIKKRRWLLAALVSTVRSSRPQAVGKGLMLSAYLSGHPDLLDDSMVMIKTFFRDLMIFTFHPKKIVNLDFYDSFNDISQKFSHPVFVKWNEEWMQAENRVTSNSSVRLTLDRFFLKMIASKGSFNI